MRVTARRVGWLLLAAIALVASMVLAGWALGIDGITQLKGAAPSMKANTALSLLALAAAAGAFLTGRRREGLVLAAAMALLNGFTVAEYVLDRDLGIDLLLVRQHVNDAAPPGRTSLAAAVALLGLAASAVAIGLGWPRAAQYSALGGGAVGLLAIMMFVYEDELMFVSPALTIAIHTATSIVALSVVLLGINARGSLTRVLAARSAGGSLARRLVPVAVVLPVVLGWLRLVSVRANLIPRATGIALLELLTLAVFVTLLVRSALSQDEADIARREARELGEKAQREAEAANAAKDDFLAMLGHELRNPLAPIFTALEIMRLRDPGAFARERTVIDRQARRLDHLVEDLLDVSRIARGELKLDIAPTDLAIVVTSALEGAEPILKERRHVVTTETAGAAWVDADADRLVQVVTNLLVNASKHTPPGGKIRVRLAADAGALTLSVEDEGSGIAPELLPRVFERFVQQRQPIERRKGGLGLGLTIVRTIIELHGGTVTVESAGLGTGATARIRLPAREPPAEASAIAPVEPVPAGSGAASRVLIVDDNEDAAFMLETLLDGPSFTTRLAHDGEAALGVALEFAPEIVLLDIGLPRLDGYEVARRLRGREAEGTSRAVIIAMTGFGQESDRRRAFDAGFDHHLVKPLDTRTLLALLERQRAPAI